MDESSGSLFSYGDLEACILTKQLLRDIRQVVNEALVSPDPWFEALYVDLGYPSIALERVIRLRPVQILF